MIRIASLCLIFALCIGCNSSKAQQDATVKTGIEVLVENNFELLQGKRVGLITNATGVNANWFLPLI